MLQVLTILPDIQARILATFSHPHLGRPCACGVAASYRCVECFNAPLWCRVCIVREHRYNPFHHIERWDGQMFVRDTLTMQRPFDKTKFPVEDVSNLHLLMQTHLAEGSCPHRRPLDPEIAEFTIADQNGFHTRWLEFCQCLRPQDHKRWQQLLGVRLFPASFEQPQTAFTFTVMKQFHVHSLASKNSAYDYVKALCQLSNNSAPETVTVSPMLNKRFCAC
jgi:CxC2 like cysteine cluster associated with KDZ transposases